MEQSVLMIVCIVTSVCALVSVVLNAIIFRRTSIAGTSGSEQEKAFLPDDGPDEELVAVFAGAIAESIGRSPSSFRIVSVTSPDGFNTPQWGHADRIARGIDASSLR